MEVAGYAAAQVFGLAHVDDLTLGILVEIDAGFGWDGADFGQEVHCWEDRFILFDDGERLSQRKRRPSRPQRKLAKWSMLSKRWRQKRFEHPTEGNRWVEPNLSVSV